MLALFSATIAALLIMDMVILIVARISRIQRQIYEEQYCLNELALITIGTDDADLVFAEQDIARRRSAASGGFSAAA